MTDIPSASLVVDFPVEVGYDDLSVGQVLRILLPPSVEVPSAFETVGHLAHLNLKAEALPYKHLIAQVIIDKNPRLTTVVNKVATIESEFRVLPLEVIGGEAQTEVVLKESGAVFHFNFAEVYWNSRLQTEHGRLIELIARSVQALPQNKKKKTKKKLADETKVKKEGTQNDSSPAADPSMVVWDVFAGVGPFSVPLAMRGCAVYANDLNACSHHYLCDNGRRNKVLAPAGNLHPSNLDGRVFLTKLAAEKRPVDHIIMNLPATALEFLDVFRGEENRERFRYLVQPQQDAGSSSSPMVHVYCFTKADDPERDVLDRAALVMDLPRGLDKDKDGISIHLVRDVAPKKLMLCVSFPLKVIYK